MKTRTDRRPLAGLLGGLGGILTLAASTLAQDAKLDLSLPGPAAASPAPAPAPTADEVVYQGTPLPGSRVAIGPDGPVPLNTSFRWAQLEGPPVAIEDPTAPKIRFTIPADAKRLVFALTVRDERGERTTRVAVPVGVVAGSLESPAAPPTADRDARNEPIADGGDDQIGLVGRRITLNGSRSRPAGRVGFRWIQVVGPPVGEVRQEGPYFSFVPTGPGIYRFALLVGLDSQVSEPDVVVVEVGQRPNAAASIAAPEVTPLQRWLGGVLPTVPRGAETAASVAEVFDGIAQRAPLYRSFAELQSELSRRLDAVVPPDPAVRAAWTNGVFTPLTQIVGGELLAIGVDVRVPATLDRPLDNAQKDRLQALYRSLAVAFRSRPATP